MGNVFVITSGEYSDYRISAVFSTKELAKEYIQHHGSDYRVEEYPLDDRVDNVLWNVLIKIDNHNVLSCRQMNEYEYKDLINSVHYVESPNGKCLRFCLLADTAEKAKKIANERLNQVLCGMDMFYRRVFIQVKGYYGFEYPIVDYNTGEII